MTLIKTNEQVALAPHIIHDDCGKIGEVMGVDLVDDEHNVWRDMYFCPHCTRNFYNEMLALWVDESGDFYAYQETADAS